VEAPFDAGRLKERLAGDAAPVRAPKPVRHVAPPGSNAENPLK
jgi:hypothetical protein